MKIIGKRYSPTEFDAYVRSLNVKNGWHGSFIVLHNTGAPTLAQRPHGFTPQHMLNLCDFYANTQHWSAGPHLFVDDNGIWVFSPLTAPGVHSPSWNHVSYGVEMLGDYSAEQFGGGVRGCAVRDNAACAIAVLSHAAGIDSHTLHLHREDPLTTHKDCPGSHVTKDDMIARVHDYIVQHLS